MKAIYFTFIFFTFALIFVSCSSKEKQLYPKTHEDFVGKESKEERDTDWKRISRDFNQIKIDRP